MEAADLASYQFFLTGAKLADEADAPTEDALDREGVHDLTESLVRRDGGRAELALERISTRFQAGLGTIRQAFYLYNLVLSFVYSTGKQGDGGEPYLQDYNELVSVYGTVGRMLKSLRSIVAAGHAAFPDIEDETQGEKLLRRIIRYVDGHFRERLSVQEISKQFGIHPNYLSHLFKKEMQVNFTKYLTDIRMEHAARVLVQTSLPVGEVAEQSGYDDYFYFAKLFKKHMGKTPSEYRVGRSTDPNLP
ncbi:AraC family transcriptional regulator [Paenibacillus sp. CC-CFT747]|nr:AraC family transcriptional regulator [Paenibacillus sp. CC-CFT747]